MTTTDRAPLANRQPTDYEFRDYGIDHSQYFPGVGVAFTQYTNVYLGVGGTPDAAVNDALESAAQNDVDTYGMIVPDWCRDATVSAHDDCDVDSPDHDYCELDYYVALFTVEEDTTEEGN